MKANLTPFAIGDTVYLACGSSMMTVAFIDDLDLRCVFWVPHLGQFVEITEHHACFIKVTAANALTHNQD